MWFEIVSVHPTPDLVPCCLLLPTFTSPAYSNMCNPDSTKTIKSNNQVPDIQLAHLRKALPDDVFVKSLLISCYYLLFDAAMWIGSLYIALLFTQSEYWKTLGFWPQALFSFLYWNFAGFFMWCLFVSLFIFSFSTISHSF